MWSIPPANAYFMCTIDSKITSCKIITGVFSLILLLEKNSVCGTIACYLKAYSDSIRLGGFVLIAFLRGLGGLSDSWRISKQT